jgi:hypothetical protein
MTDDDLDGYLNWFKYQNRAKAVYWNRSASACRAKGPSKAECLLEPNHSGPHFGNGFDQWGPRSPIHWLNHKAAQR